MRPMLPYSLVRPLGRSARAEVWEARHPDGTPVALKRTRGPAASLLNEARSVARLHHPGVVQVLDLGEQDGRAVVVQELAPGGALPDAAAGSWPEARDILAQVLHALAHAHARGLVHCDLKPANLLRFEEAPRVRLGDFGIARALSTAEETISGTLAYAAPEQLRGDALSPATDLYALGCLGWLLLTGAPPFEGDGEALEFAHQFSPLPELRPAFRVPPAAEGWLRGLLEKDPLDRPHLAADALAGLRQVDPALPAPPRRRRARPAGLELGALREPVLVGRHAEKARLRAALEALSGPERLVLSGPPGSGKTALAEWLLTEAHAAGQAVGARLGHGPGALAGEVLGCAGAPSWLAEERVDEALACSAHLLPGDRAALLALLGDDHALPPRELHALLPRLLRHAARGRPLVLLADEHPVHDAVLEGLAPDPILVLEASAAATPGSLHLGPLPDEAASLLLEDLAPLPAPEVHRLVDRGAGNPQLLVLLAQDPVLPADLRRAWRERVLGLCPQPEALALAALLGRLVTEEEWAAGCAARGLPLPDLAPLVRAGLVEPLPEGFRFRQALAREALLDHPALPELRLCLAEVLLERSARFLRTGNPVPAAALLEELDALDLPVDLRSRWCTQRADLARWEGEDPLPWARAAVAAAEGPAARVRARQRLALALQRAGDPGAAALREATLAEAMHQGLHDVAAHSAMHGAMQLTRSGQLDEALASLEAVRRHLPEVATRELAQLDLTTAWLSLRLGRLQAAIALAQRARPVVLSHGLRLQAYHSLTYEGDALRLLGQLDAAEACFAEALALCEAMGTEAGTIARLNLGIVRLQRGQPDAAGPLLRAAARHFEAQQRATVEAAARCWLLCCEEGPAREATLERVEALLERSPGRDPDLLEAASFAGARWPDPRLLRIVEGLR